MADLADRGPVAGNQNRSSGLQPGVHALFPVGDDVPRSIDHGEGHRGSREATLRVGLGEQVFAEQLVHPVLDLVVATFLGVVLPDGKSFGG